MFLSIGIAVWKGGAPFRWVGEKTVAAGRIIQKIGDYVDDIKAGSQKVKKTYKEIKGTVSPAKEEKTQNK